MNEILEYIAKTEIEQEVSLIDLTEQVKKLHEKQIIAAYNRGRASMMGVFMMTAEQYYSKNYGED
tara:strand:+ start:2059 stop:2253 length:195 start_codon:yes stop_codon:yes gene_type:complete